MDIRCPSCDTVYAFDTSPFGPDGVNVRCSVCKAVFRAAPSVPQLLVVWYALRPTTGVTREATGMAELQQLAMQGLVAGDDLISNDRVNWQRADALQPLRPFFAVPLSLAQSPDAAAHLTHLSRTGSHESFPRPGRVAQITEGATSVAAAPAVATPGSAPWPERHITSPAPTIASSGTSPVAALDDAATRNMHPLSDEQVGGEPVGRITSTSGTIAPRTTAPIRDDGRVTTAVSPATIASQRLHPVDPVTSPTPSLPHSVGPPTPVARQDNPALSTSQFSVAPDPHAFAPAAHAASAPAHFAPQQPQPAAPVVSPPSPAFATHAMAVHDVEAAVMRSTYSPSREPSAPTAAPDPGSFPSASPPLPWPETAQATGPSPLTQTMRATPATRPPAPVYAAPAVLHPPTPDPAQAQPPQQASRPDARTSPPATPRPAQQLKALRPDGSRPLPDRYTLGRSGLDDNNDEWRVGDKPMDLPHEPGDGRAPRSETLDVPQIPGTKPLYKVLAVAGLVAVVAVAAIVMTRPSSQTVPETDADGSASSGVAASATDAGATLAGQTAADGSSEGSASSADGSAAEASAGEASAAEASAAAPPTAAVTPDARPRTDAAPARRPAPAQPAEDDYDALMDQAERALSARRYNEAVDLFAAAADQSNRAEAHVGAGRAYAGLRQWHVAAARFQRAIDRNPRYMPAWYELGNARSQSGDTAGAVAAWQRVVDESRDQQLVRRAQSAIEGAQ